MRARSGLTGLAGPRTVRRSLTQRPEPTPAVASRAVTSQLWELSREQAHVPAEQPASQPNAWFPSSDADTSRPRHCGCSPAQGPHKAFRLKPVDTPVLPKNARMTRSADFQRTIRSGVRVSRPTLVLHADRDPDTRVLVGFVVSRGIGSAVVRNRVRRRLRHLVAERLATTPAGTDIVVRALPRSATSPAALSSDLAGAWTSALGRLAERSKA